MNPPTLRFQTILLFASLCSLPIRWDNQKSATEDTSPTTLPVECEDPESASISSATNIRPAAVEGLALAAREGHVEGTYTHNATTIRFVIERDGARRTAILTTDDGSPLLESIAEAGHETLKLFGGRTVISGDPHSPEPSVEGELDTFEKLKAMPEGPCIAGLHEALEEAGIDPAILGAAPENDAITQPLTNDATYRTLGPNESILVGTWGWLTYTHIGMRIGQTLWGATVGDGCVRFRAGAGGWAYVCGPAGRENLHARQSWGTLLTIQNFNQNVTMKVRTY